MSQFRFYVPSNFPLIGKSTIHYHTFCLIAATTTNWKFNFYIYSVYNPLLKYKYSGISLPLYVFFNASYSSGSKRSIVEVEIALQINKNIKIAILPISHSNHPLIYANLSEAINPTSTKSLPSPEEVKQVQSQCVFISTSHGGNGFVQIGVCVSIRICLFQLKFVEINLPGLGENCTCDRYHKC